MICRIYDPEQTQVRYPLCRTPPTEARDPKGPDELLGSDYAGHPSALPERLHEGVPAPVRMPGRPQRVMYGPERDVHTRSRSGDQYPTTSPSGEPKRSHRLMNLFQD